MENQESTYTKKTCPVHPDKTTNALDSFQDCQYCVEDAKKESAEREKARFDEMIKQRLDRLGTGERFRQKEFNTLIPTNDKSHHAINVCKRYVETFVDRRAAGDNLLFLGTEGTGKTHLAIAIAKGVVRKGYTAYYTALFTMINNFKRSWGTKEVNEEAIMKLYTEPDLLVIDEIGVQFKSQTEQVYLMNIVNTRYENLRPTIMIANLDEEKLIETVGAQVVDRFYEGKSSIISCAWESHRRKEHEPA